MNPEMFSARYQSLGTTQKPTITQIHHITDTNIRYSYLLDEDVTAFDTEFFGIKPIEAKAIDPQQRVLMETVYESLESAGLTIDGLRGSDTAVYVGVMCSDYEANLLRDCQYTLQKASDQHSLSCTPND